MLSYRLLALLFAAQLAHCAVPATTLIPTVLNPAANIPAPTVVPQQQSISPSSPVNVAGGSLICHSPTIFNSTPEFFMTQEEAAAAISKFCGRINPGVVFKQTDGTPYQNVRVDGPFAYPMIVSAIWSPGYTTNCPILDFSNSTSVATCKSNLNNILSQCNTDQMGFQFWKGGGSFAKDCITWGIKRVSSL